jgi:flagellar basal-body rod protein FlgF
MIYGLYHSAAGMLVNEYRQNVIANNLANADTVGFKEEVATFAERQPEPLAGSRAGPSADGLANLSGGLWLGQTHTHFGQGTLVPTGAATDVALEGPGFLVVQGDDQPLYTRDGRFVRDTDGMLRSATDGAPVLSPSGAPILTNPRGADPVFDEDGRIWQDGAVVGQLAVVDFADLGALRQAGAARFDAGEAETVSSPARIRQGHVESSGVEPVKELVNMIETSRAYQMNASMVSLQDQSVGRLVTILAR